MPDNTDRVACQRCGVAAGLFSTIRPFGSSKGAKIYGCPDCRHFTWIDWHGNTGGQQLQQPQSPKPDER